MSSLELAKSKLQGYINFEDLPERDTAPLWDRIERDCHLTIGELSALQNAVCSTGQ